MGDEVDEFTTFVASSSAALFRLAGLLTSGDTHTAQDLVQEAYSETYRRWGRIREPEARLAYARRVLVRAATRRWKQVAADRQHLKTFRVGPSASWHAEQVDVEQDLLAALRELSARQRAVVVLRYYEDLTEAATADVLGCSVGAVKSHSSRAMRALQQVLGGSAYFIEESEGTP